MNYLKLAIITLLLSFLIACNTSEGESEEGSSGNNKIITSIYPIEYIVSEIGGDEVSVETVMPAGADAHTYEPSTKRMIELADSDGFFYVGAGLESFAEAMSDTIEGEGVHTLALSEHEELFLKGEEESHNEDDEHNSDEEESHSEEDEQGHDDEESHSDEDDGHDHGDFDPHFWLDPTRMIDAGDIVLQELIKLYPEKESTFKENYQAFSEEMIELDSEFEQTLHGDEHYQILVAHKAFGYWENRYRLEQFSIRGISSSQEPSQKELQEIFKKIEEMKINHIILEKNRDDRLVETIVEEQNMELLYLHNLATRTEDEIEEEKDYIELMRENLEVLKESQQ
ncbi:adhesin [Halalkalibacillus sediminis]|uniref:Adhesin n=1 Tax=Halalkalibacillus sediminis TaxID=2018042 RepID=A0A2I0QVD6_9BACI|nr:zinc ABC transporter substrate-binding protein [Halalkalibacillus sediminis]PKR78060.1 adhesin [Halalkalibacillus sediminis]